MTIPTGRPSGGSGRPLPDALGTAVRELRNLVDLGRMRRRERALPLVPGEVVVGWLLPVDATPEDATLADDLMRAALLAGLTRPLIAGAARVVASADLTRLGRAAPGQERTERSPTDARRPRTWVLRCRPGTERDLVAILAGRAARLERAGRAPWRPGTFVATRVPFLHTDGDPIGGQQVGEVRFSSSIDNSLECRRIDHVASDGAGMTIGVLDVGVDRAALAGAGLGPSRVTVQTWEQGPVGEALRPVPDPPPPDGGQWHGTAVVSLLAKLAPGATLVVLEARETLGSSTRRNELAASWLLHALDQLRFTDLINVSLSVDRGGAEYAPYFEQFCTQVLRQHAETRRHVMVAAVGKIRAPYISVDQLPRRTPPSAPVDVMGYPARDPNVIAVGSLASQWEPAPDNRAGGKQGILHWLEWGGSAGDPVATRGGNAPVYGSSFATAIFTATLARLAADGRPYEDTAARAQTLQTADKYTQPRPHDMDGLIWGRGLIWYWHP